MHIRAGSYLAENSSNVRASRGREHNDMIKYG